MSFLPFMVDSRNQRLHTIRYVKFLEYKKSVKQKFKKSFLSGEQVSLDALYTEPVIIQKNKRGSLQNISVEKLFDKPTKHLSRAETVVLHGSSGSGKSFISQKMLLDWASGKDYLQHFDVVFYLRCEELKCVSEEMTLFELLSLSSSLPPDQISQILLSSAFRVLIIIDGLDELTFVHSDFWTPPPSQRASAEIVVYSLLSKQFLPRSSLLITTSTEVPQGVYPMRSRRLSKIMGFSEKGVEEYFQRFFQDEELFRKAFKCVKANETLISACSIPVICWILCTVLREHFSEGSDLTSRLETTTSIHVDFVSTLLEHHGHGLGQTVPTLLRSLSQLAERGMLEQRVLLDLDPAKNPFLSNFLCSRTICQETTFSFMHRSFQEFFAALYFVLLDEEESQRKVKELLYTVEKEWPLSCSSDPDFSMADAEVRHSEFLQPVILFLCGLCRKDLIPSFFEKHNMAVSVNIETQLKDWINKCSQRYQNKHLLFILHCLYELHQKSFAEKVLEQLISLDLSNTPLTNTDYRMLQFCLQSGVKVSNLRLNVTSDYLKSLHSALYCDELWLKVDHITDDVGDLISAFGEGKIVKKLIVQNQKGSKASQKIRTKSFYQKIMASVKDEEFTLSVSCSKTTPLSFISGLTLTCSCSEISTVDWRIFLQKLSKTPSSSVNEFLPLDALHCVTGLKKIQLQIERWTDGWIPKILSLVQAFPSLNELRLKVDHITDDVGDLISAFGEGKIVKKLIVQNQKGSKASQKIRTKSFYQKIMASVKDEEFTLSVSCSKTTPLSFISGLTLTCSCSEISTVDWRIFLQKLSKTLSSSVNEFLPLDALHCVTGLKKIQLQIETWTDGWIPKILSLVQAFPSLNELRINAAISIITFNFTKSLRESLTTGWKLTVWRKSMLIKRDRTCVTEEELKTIKKENTESKRAESSSGQPTSGVVEIFAPERIQDNDKHNNTYRFVCPHAGQFQCSLTSLVFVMEGEGELLYRVVSWDPRLLDGLGQMQPAGPLYDIDCINGSISKLYLPHCEIFSEETKDSLSVAHFTGDNISIMKHCGVSDTHVLIDIKDLSKFGLFKNMLCPPSPIIAQVLVFLRPVTVRRRENILDVLLLPWTVPLSEVKEQHAENTHLKTSSKCSLTPKSQYRLCCQPEGSTVQPASETFDCNFGPNYHPTFEVFVNVNTEEVRLGLLDKAKGAEVWVPRRIPLTGQDVEPLLHRRLSESEFVKKHRDKLIDRMLSAKAIADSLLAKDMITRQKNSEIQAAEPQQERTRLLLDALESGGASVKAEFCKLLKEKEPYLVDDLLK